MKLIIKIVLSVVLVFMLIIAGGMIYITRGLGEGSQQVIKSVNISSLDDGIYNGEYKAGRWSNQVRVTVQGHKITNVEVVKDVTFADPKCSKAIIDRVIQKQDTDVEVVSGATVTSKAYLKSIENALGK